MAAFAGDDDDGDAVLAERELLQAMYATPEELEITQAGSYLFTLGALALRVALPPGYPSSAPPKVTFEAGMQAPPDTADAVRAVWEAAGRDMCVAQVVAWAGELAPGPPPSEGDADADAADAPDDANGAAGGGDGVPEPPLLQRQWITFIGFYTKSIIKAFCQTAAGMGLTGFLMPGKPAVAALEGSAADIAAFVRVTRTDLFAKVNPASRKMTLSLLEEEIAARAFDGFEELKLLTSCSGEAGAKQAHKRKDMADLGKLHAFLSARGLGHAFEFMFPT